MFASLSRSWEFAKLSYRTVLDHKQLMVFPLVSSVASVLVMASFLLPLWQTGQLEAWASMVGDEQAPQDPALYITTFLFYFANYFVIVFFNTALVASVMDILEGGRGGVGFGLRFAGRRLHAIFGWALVSAVVGMLLRAIERNRKAGALIASLIGSAWTALTYFVIPVIVAEGVGPVEAFKRSMRTLKDTWGTALAGNFSMGGIALLLMLPILAIGALLFVTVDPYLAVAVAVPMMIAAVLLSSTADAIFRAYLYAYATGRTLPADADRGLLGEAFTARG